MVLTIQTPFVFFGFLMFFILRNYVLNIHTQIFSATTIVGQPMAWWQAIGWELPGSGLWGLATGFPIGPSS